MTALLVNLRDYLRNLIFSDHNGIGAVARFGKCEQYSFLLVPKELFFDIVTAAEVFGRVAGCDGQMVYANRRGLLLI